MTKEVLALVKEKKMMLEKYQRTRLDVHREKWLKLKTQVSNRCRKAEHDYWEEQLKDGVDSHTMWKQSYKYIGQKSPGAPTQVVVADKMITEPSEVANACQDALLGKVDRITSNIPKSNDDPIQYTRDYVASKNLCTFEFPTCNLMRGVGYKEVKKAIKSLKNTTASGVDNLSTKFLKMLRTPLLHVLTCICNRSFEQRKSKANEVRTISIRWSELVLIVLKPFTKKGSFAVALRRVLQELQRSRKLWHVI